MWEGSLLVLLPGHLHSQFSSELRLPCPPLPVSLGPIEMAGTGTRARIARPQSHGVLAPIHSGPCRAAGVGSIPEAALVGSGNPSVHLPGKQALAEMFWKWAGLGVGNHHL